MQYEYCIRTVRTSHTSTVDLLGTHRPYYSAGSMVVAHM